MYGSLFEFLSTHTRTHTRAMHPCRNWAKNPVAPAGNAGVTMQNIRRITLCGDTFQKFSFILKNFSPASSLSLFFSLRQLRLRCIFTTVTFSCLHACMYNVYLWTFLGCYSKTLPLIFSEIYDYQKKCYATFLDLAPFVSKELWMHGAMHA